MICLFGKGDMVDGVSSYVDDLGSIIIIIKNVPCHRCTQCGEESFQGSVKTIDRYRDSLSEFTVVHFYKQAG